MTRTPEFLSQACSRSLLLIAVHPRNSAIRCLLLYFSKPPALPFTMVAPVPARITKLRPRPLAATSRHAQLTAHPLFTCVICPAWRQYLSRSQQFPEYFPSPRGCTLHHSRRQTFRPPGMPSLLFALTCRLFAFSSHSFLHSFPLFSIVCSLFSENTGWGTLCCAFSRLRTLNSFASYQIPASPAVSYDHALFRATAHEYPCYSQQLAHSFYRHGGGTLCALCVSQLRALCVAIFPSFLEPTTGKIIGVGCLR
jgi:hypothetical protein